ncbi:MAG: hypothetical protein AAF389_14990 [Gemmatimonadota bacterium]
MTLSEKKDLRLVADIDNTTEADLLRDKTLEEIAARASQIRRDQREIDSRPSAA